MELYISVIRDLKDAVNTMKEDHNDTTKLALDFEEFIKEAVYWVDSTAGKRVGGRGWVGGRPKGTLRHEGYKVSDIAAK